MSDKDQIKFSDPKVVWWLMEAVSNNMWDSLDEFVEDISGIDVTRVTGVEVDINAEDKRVATIKYQSL